jgi:hypothetical protein
MKNQSVSDFVAAHMDAVLNSKEHKSLFGTQYKFAQDLNDAKKKKDDSDKDSCMADDQDAKKKKDSSDDSSASDMNDARKKKDDSDKDSCMADDDDNDARKKKDDSDKDSCMADDDNDAKKSKKCPDCGKPMNFCKCDKSDADDQDARKKKDSSDSNSANSLASSQGNPYPSSMESGYRNADVLRADDMEPSVAFDVAIDSLLTASAALDSVGLGRGSALTLKIASLVVEAKKKDKKEKDSKKSSKDSHSAKDKKSSKDSKDSKKSSKDSHSAKDKKSSDKDSKKSSSSSSKK